VAAAGIPEKLPPQLPGRHLERNLIPAGRVPHRTASFVTRQPKAPGQIGHKHGVSPGVFPPEAVVVVSHAQVKPQFGTEPHQEVEQGHRIRAAGDRHQDPVAGR
jgi:hypothetical protein